MPVSRHPPLPHRPYRDDTLHLLSSDQVHVQSKRSRADLKCPSMSLSKSRRCWVHAPSNPKHEPLEQTLPAPAWRTPDGSSPPCKAQTLVAPRALGSWSSWT